MTLHGSQSQASSGVDIRELAAIDVRRSENTATRLQGGGAESGGRVQETVFVTELYDGCKLISYRHHHIYSLHAMYFSLCLSIIGQAEATLNSTQNNTTNIQHIVAVGYQRGHPFPCLYITVFSNPAPRLQVCSIKSVTGSLK